MKLVHYISPFGSPAWMTREQADRQLAKDDRQWEYLAAVSRETGCDLISARQRQIGPPRIEGLHS